MVVTGVAMVARRAKRSAHGASALLGMPVARFLRDYWQRKPLLVRGAFGGSNQRHEEARFVDPILPDELAGLACEEEVESRIVREKGGSTPWEVTWGPHPESRFSTLPKRGWTLLVQEVNRWVPDAALMLDRFSFIPNVRVDDVMVSFAAPGGSVGPHVDSYDVFLVQGQGRRRWRYHTKPTRDLRLVPRIDLRVLSHFEPDADEELGPGDMLYIPPGFAHYGVAVTPCLTYSIGFRAPNAGEVWTSFAADARTRPEASELLGDPPLSASAHPGAIPEALLERVRAMVRSLDTSDERVDRWFAAFSTRLKPGHEMQASRRPPSEARLLARLAKGVEVVRSEEGRWAFLPRPRGALWLYVGGEEIDVPAGAASLARRLTSARRHDGGALLAEAQTPGQKRLLTRLFAMGALALRR